MMGRRWIGAGRWAQIARGCGVDGQKTSADAAWAPADTCRCIPPERPAKLHINHLQTIRVPTLFVSRHRPRGRQAQRVHPLDGDDVAQGQGRLGAVAEGQGPRPSSAATTGSQTRSRRLSARVRMATGAASSATERVKLEVERLPGNDFSTGGDHDDLSKAATGPRSSRRPRSAPASRGGRAAGPAGSRSPRPSGTRHQ